MGGETRDPAGSRPRRRISWARAALWLVGTAIVVAALHAARDEWTRAAATVTQLHPDWTLVAASAALVLANYSLLIEIWRRVLVSLGEQITWPSAMQIWLTSNLARYLPGALWQLGVLGVLARRRRISPVIATASALFVTLVNTLAGVGLAVATGVGTARMGAAAVVMCALGVAGVIASPYLIPHAVRASRVVLRRELSLPRLPVHVVWLVAVASIVSWALYGVAFRLLDRAVFGPSQQPTGRFIAAYTASYLTGLISPMPAGAGVSDSVLANLYAALGIGPLSRGLVIAAVSRVWRTALEVVPGIVVIAASAWRRRGVNGCDPDTPLPAPRQTGA